MKRLYSWGKFNLDIGRSFTVEKEGWYLTDSEQSATEVQQHILEYLGWGRDQVTVKGANTIIMSILETAEDQ